MKRIKTFGAMIVVLIIIFSVITSGCRRRYSQDMVVMYTQVFLAIPGTRFYDPNVIKGETIETDEYGRIWFSFSTGSMSGECIMQRHDDKYVYYYDNVSYQITEEYKNRTTEELDAFKEANDWNKPINEAKMIKRELVNEYSLRSNIKWSFDEEIAKKAFHDTVEEKDCEIGIGIIDYSQNDLVLLGVSRGEDKINENGSWNGYIPIDRYFMILNTDGTYDPENYLIQYDSLSQTNAPLAEIKARNGWIG